LCGLAYNIYVEKGKDNYMSEKLIQVYKIFEVHKPKPDNPQVKIHADKFRSLIGVMLSSQTRDEQTQKATKSLFKKASTPEEMLLLSDDAIRTAIKPVSFYNRKTEYIKKLSQQLIDLYNGEVPETRAELMKLTGVGRKSVDIMMRFVFGEPAIAVDTHVHRVVNRLGIVSTNNANQTADFLEKNTPEEYKWNAHDWFISHGKYTCKAVGKPICKECPFKDICTYENKEL